MRLASSVPALSIACVLAAGSLPVASEAPPGGLGVLALEAGDGGCAWTHYPLDGGEGRAFHQTPSCPTHVLWSPDGTQLWHHDGETLVNESWPPAAEPIETRPLPSHSWETWFDASTGALRVGRALDAEDQGDGRWRVPELNETFTVKKGGTWVGTMGDGSSLNEELFMVPWGLEAMAVIEELGPDGWQVVARAPTTCYAGDTPCIDQLSSFIAPHPRAVSLMGALDAARGQDFALPDGWYERDDLAASLGSEGWDETGHYPVADGHLLFAMVMGDTLHPMPPLYWCTGDCSQLTELATPQVDTFTVQVHGSHFLVVEEATGAKPRLFLAGQTEPLLDLPEAARAALLELP